MSFLVVGAGLFGSIIAAALRARGASVIVVDDARLEAGSRPAACLMKPGWFSGLGKSVYTPALSMLEELYGVKTIKFKMGRIAQVPVKWCDPASILLPADRKDTVKVIRRGRKGHVALLASGKAVQVSTTIVAAGVWTPLLFPKIKVQGQAGVACLWPDAYTDYPTIQLWAPYKQLVAFNRGDGLWVGDGSAIKWSNWTGERAQETVMRCCNFLGRTDPPRRLFGIRPYVDRSPCYLEEVERDLWVATGGAKNGTIAAAWCASELVRRYA
jgi:glycine/D-amino acid oxidase-like deaminating enzyme